MSTVSGKVVAFNLYVGDALHKHDAASSSSLSPLELSVVKTSEGLNALRDAVYYSKLREERHAETVNSTNTRVLFWSGMNGAALLVMALAQIVLLRGLFEKTRKV